MGTFADISPPVALILSGSYELQCHGQKHLVHENDFQCFICLCSLVIAEVAEEKEILVV